MVNNFHLSNFDLSQGVGLPYSCCTYNQPVRLFVLLTFVYYVVCGISSVRMVHTEHGYISLQMWMSVRLKLTTAIQMQSATIQEGHLLASATEMRYTMATGRRALITVSGQSLILF